MNTSKIRARVDHLNMFATDEGRYEVIACCTDLGTARCFETVLYRSYNRTAAMQFRRDEMARIRQNGGFLD